MSDPTSTLRKIADACERSGDPNALAFGAALRDGAPLEAFGLEYMPWLRRWFTNSAVERRDKAIAEIGKLISPDGAERALALMFDQYARGRPAVAEPEHLALVEEVFQQQKIVYPDRPNTPPSRHTIRRARRRYGK